MKFDVAAFLRTLLPALVAAVLAGLGVVYLPPLVNPLPAPVPAPGPAPESGPISSPAPDPQYPRGARRAPAEVVASAEKFCRVAAAPAQFARVPTYMSMWGNQRYGDCVTAEECFAKIADVPNIMIREETAVQWAAQRGFLNGAYLPDVLDAMARDGIQGIDGKVYKDGPKKAVDWTNQADLESAIAQGTVKIAVAADQIQRAVSANRGSSGWSGIGWRNDDNTDHCVSLTGYGTADYLYQQLGRPRPAAVPADRYGYLMFTWQSIGFVDRLSMLAVTREAWFRVPTTAGFDPTPPPPPPPPPPVSDGFSGVLEFQRGALVRLTPAK